MRILCFLFAALALAYCISEKTNLPEHLKKDTNVVSDGKEGEFGKTRLILLEYSYDGESVVYDAIENKAAAPSTIVKANYTWETLHHDSNNNVLARFRMTNCMSGDCGTIPDIYVNFVQGGNNLISVFMDLNDHPDYVPKWNWLLGVVSIIHTPALYGEGDNQVVESPYGRCLYQFGRPADKLFRRKVSHCELKGDHNYTKYDGITLQDYSHEIFYTQNTKIDPDIVIVEAVEHLTLNTPEKKGWGFNVESRVRLELDNRTRLYVPRHCHMDDLVDDCAVNKFKATKVGGKLFENVLKGVQKPPNNIKALIADYRKHLFAMGESHTCDDHPRRFAKILNAAREADETQLTAVIRDPDNEPVLAMIANVLGSLGSELGLKVAREVLFNDGPEFLDDYLFGAANAVSNNRNWHKQLMYWLLNEKGTNEQNYWKIANTVATVLRRKCEATPSASNSCAKGKERIVTKFISEITDCKSNEVCVEKALKVLSNLPFPESYQFAQKFVCNNSTEKVRQAALDVIKTIPRKFYDSQLVSLAVKVFRDTCPSHSTTSMAMKAIDILLECMLDFQNAATLLLRTESFSPVEAERWHYLYKAVEMHRQKDELKDQLWKQMRSFKVFRPTWAPRALVSPSDSGTFHNDLHVLFGYRSHLDSSFEFADGIFQGSDLTIDMSKKKHNNNLFQLTMSSSGLNSFITESGAPSDNKQPEATVRMGLLGHKLPPVTIFDGHNQLMSAVWNADGQTLKAFEGNVILRDYESALPLMSGASLNCFVQGAVNVKILGSCEISVWNRDSITKIDTNVSMSLDSSITLVNHGIPVRTISSQLSAVSTISSRTDVHFNEVPPEFCLTVGMKDTRVRFGKSTEEHGASKTTKRNTVKILPGKTFALSRGLTQKCNQLASHQTT